MLSASPYRYSKQMSLSRCGDAQIGDYLSFEWEEYGQLTVHSIDLLLVIRSRRCSHLNGVFNEVLY